MKIIIILTALYLGVCVFGCIAQEPSNKANEPTVFTEPLFKPNPVPMRSLGVNSHDGSLVLHNGKDSITFSTPNNILTIASERDNASVQVDLVEIAAMIETLSSHRSKARKLAGFEDEDEFQILCERMVTKLLFIAAVAPSAMTVTQDLSK